MPVETDADLAALFETDEFAESASYAPPGAGDAVPCTVIVNRGQARRTFQAKDREAVSSERSLLAQASELGSVAREGVFTMLDEAGAPTGEIFSVATMPKLDETGQVWTVELLLVD